MNSLGTKRADNEMPACMLPLDQRQISFSRNGVKDEISAINKLWADLQYEWIPYRPPPQPQDLSVAGASETWSERSKMIIEDLDHLLRLPYHKVITFQTFHCRDHRNPKNQIIIIEFLKCSLKNKKGLVTGDVLLLITCHS